MFKSPSQIIHKGLSYVFILRTDEQLRTNLFKFLSAFVKENMVNLPKKNNKCSFIFPT